MQKKLKKKQIFKNLQISQSNKSDNYIDSNREMYNIAVLIFEKLTIFFRTKKCLIFFRNKKKIGGH